MFDRSNAMSEFVGPDASRVPAGPAAISPFRMRRVLRHVDENLHRRIGLQELATLAGLSPWYFCRAFKREMGLPPNRYILALRLDRACRLLSSPGARLADVAATVGFSSQAHFTSAFTRMLGMPPGRWRARPTPGASGIAEG
jgi:AraC family transcriptional regulator